MSSSKNEFIEIYTQNIRREGSEKLLEYLENSDFFSAPASAKFHMAEEGGLCKHSLNVYHRLVKTIKAEYGDDYRKVFSDETLAIVGLLHDLCKVNFYTIEHRNVKEDNTWVKKSVFQGGGAFSLRTRRKVGIHNFAVHKTYCGRSNSHQLAHGRI